MEDIIPKVKKKKNLLELAEFRVKISDTQQTIYESILNPPKHLQRPKKQPLSPGIMVQITASNSQLAPGAKSNPPLAKGDYGIIVDAVRYLPEEDAYVYTVTPADDSKFEDDISMELKESMFIKVDMAEIKKQSEALKKKAEKK